MTDQIDPRSYIAPSVSDAARAKLEYFRVLLAGFIKPEIPRTLQDYDAAAERAATMGIQFGAATIAALEPMVVERDMGGVPVLDVSPRGHSDDGSAIVYIHGGGFVQGSARSTLITAALIAETSGRRVFSIDYTLAPRGKADTIRAQVVAVWTRLLETHDPAKLGMMGDSAGGCIAAAATLALRDRGVAMPAALVLLSPCTDLAGGGDTNVTLEPVDYLDRATGAANRDAYADGADLTDPLVSPIHGDFTKGYPPVLLQAGTRELLLSDSVRLHRALRAAGRSSRLEIFEGMPHVFQSLFVDTPEGQAAWADMTDFWAEHLR